MTNIFNTTRTALTTSVAGLCLMGSMASAQQVFNTDVIVDGSLCVGLDCTSSESFGFDTIRLKENNLRINFDDTSATASFPSNDWRITINDSSNGGASYFAIEDSTAGRVPFRIEAGAQANTLYVESDGDVGIKTANPVVDLHIVEGNTPTLRLEQDGSDGFTPQTYDVAANEANFFIRDVTSGSRLFFRAKPGAPEDSLFIAADGDVGFGTDNPDGKLHMVSGAANTDLVLEQSGGTPTEWILRNNQATGRMTFRNNTTGLTPFKMGNTAVENLLRVGTQANDQVDVAGNMVLTGTITTSGSCNLGCDRVFDADYDLLSIEEHSEAMFANKYLPNIGATPEDGPFNLTHKVGGMLNELEHAHIYISQLHEQLGAKEDRLSLLEAEVSALKEKLN